MAVYVIPGHGPVQSGNSFEWLVPAHGIFNDAGTGASTIKVGGVDDPASVGGVDNPASVGGVDAP